MVHRKRSNIVAIELDATAIGIDQTGDHVKHGGLAGPIWAEQADCLFFDGTFWSEDELRELGASEKRAGEMAHLPIGGDGGSLAALGGLRTPRRIYIHLNNTNPVLREVSPERATVERAGWQIARDGMELTL